MMNIADVATVLGISRAGAYKLAHDSHFPAFQIGKRIVVSREKFLDWLNRQGEEQNAHDGRLDLRFGCACGNRVC